MVYRTGNSKPKVQLRNLGETILYWKNEPNMLIFTTSWNLNQTAASVFFGNWGPEGFR